MTGRRPAPPAEVRLPATPRRIGSVALGFAIISACARPPAPAAAPVAGGLAARPGTTAPAPPAPAAAAPSEPPTAAAASTMAGNAAGPSPSAASAGATAEAADPKGPAAPLDPRGAPLRARGTITIAGRASSPKIGVELARTEEERARGLMFRHHLAPATGMLFFMPGDEPWKFWMKNTWISLDMIFIDAEWSVVDVLPAVPPNNLVSRGVARPSRYVLELAADEAARLGIVPGARLLFTPDSASLTDRTPR